MNAAADNVKVTGTKAALRKLAKAVGGEIAENPRDGALYVNVPRRNDDIGTSADARTDGSVAYRTADGTLVLAESQSQFLAACRGKPRFHDNVQRHVAIVDGVICRID